MPMGHPRATFSNVASAHRQTGRWQPLRVGIGGAVVVMAFVAGLLFVGCDSTDDAGDFATNRDQFFSLVGKWETAREAETAAVRKISDDFSDIDGPSFEERTDFEHRLAEERREKAKLEAQLGKNLAAMIASEPYHVRTREAETRFLAVLCAEVEALHAHRNELIAKLRTLQLRPTLYDVHRSELDAIERRIGQQFTRLQELFPQSALVAKLEDKVLYRRYRELISNMPDRRIPPQDEVQYLRKLAEMKELYPKSNFTRRAEKHLVPRTAKRSLWDLRGWPAAVFFVCVALILFAFGRCLAGYLKHRQAEDDEPGSRVFRPAPWMLQHPAPYPMRGSDARREGGAAVAPQRPLRPPVRTETPPDVLPASPPTQTPRPAADLDSDTADAPVVTPLVADSVGAVTEFDGEADEVESDDEPDFTPPGSGTAIFIFSNDSDPTLPPRPDSQPDEPSLAEREP